MKKEQYIEARNSYYRNAKEKSETMMRLHKEFAEETDRLKKKKKELNELNQTLSKTIYDVSCKEREVSLLKESNRGMSLLDHQINKAKKDLKQLESTGKAISDMMKDNGVIKMSNIIDDWISYCKIVSKQIR